MEKARVELWIGISQRWQDIFWPLRKKQCTFAEKSDVGFRLTVRAIAYGFSGGYTWTSKNYYQSAYHVPYEDHYPSFARYNVTPRLVIR